MTEHRYNVDQTVALADSAGLNLKQAGAYRITAILPERGSDLQYRVKGEHELFERVVSEHQITAPARPPVAA